MGNIMSASFAPECTDLKTKYDSCFNEWYSEKFLKENPLRTSAQNNGTLILHVSTQLSSSKVLSLL